MSFIMRMACNIQPHPSYSVPSVFAVTHRLGAFASMSVILRLVVSTFNHRPSRSSFTAAFSLDRSSPVLMWAAVDAGWHTGYCRWRYPSKKVTLPEHPHPQEAYERMVQGALVGPTRTRPHPQVVKAKRHWSIFEKFSRSLM